MCSNAPGIILPALFCAAGAWCQTPQSPPQNAAPPRTNLVQRTVAAVNYQYQKAPTQVEFQGTDLDPNAKGSATVQSKSGRTDIQAHFEQLSDATGVGNAYLTYVLWAITPEGRAANLGEIIPGRSRKAKLHVTTQLQAFGLIVTAEPYAAVRLPSDAVVLENQILPTTTGAIKPIEAKYELLPRIQYSAVSGPQPVDGRVSGARYKAILQVYQAENALQIAAAAGAGQLASDTYARAQELFTNAQQMLNHKGDNGTVIATAREAAQTAEDARDLAYRRARDAVVAAAVTDAERERQRRMQAEALAAAAVAQSDADREMLARERQERDREQARISHPAASVEQGGSAQREAAAVERDAQQPAAGQHRSNSIQQQSDLRFNIYNAISQHLEVNDTPRGLVATLPADDFNVNQIQDAVKQPLADIASILRAYPGLAAEVTARGRPADNDPRTLAVRTMLMADGAPANAVTVRMPSDNPDSAAPIAAGPLQGGVDICIRGEPIGRP